MRPRALSLYAIVVTSFFAVQAPTHAGSQVRDAPARRASAAGDGMGGTHQGTHQSQGAGVSNAKTTASQEKRKDCKDEASTRELKGAERKAFMSDCLKSE